MNKPMDRRFTTKDGAQHRVVDHVAGWEGAASEDRLFFRCGDMLETTPEVAARGYESERTVTIHYCDGCFPEWRGV